MDPQTLIALRDPAGLPFYPVVFLLLAILTFALHMFSVQLMLGASVLTVLGGFRAETRWRRLSQAMLEVAKIGVSVAIVLGVAPLLFVQVIYDPFWYSSNVLSARWVIYFIGILIVAYWLLYLFYFRNRGRGPEHRPRHRWAMVISVLLLLTVGFIMHVLTYQMLQPDQWMAWYAPNGALDTSGAALHAYSPARFLFFISLSAPVVGAWLIAYRHYFSARTDADQDYLAWAGNLGIKLMRYGTPVAIVLGIAWMLGLPEALAPFVQSPWPWVAAAALLAYTGLGFMLREDNKFGGYGPLVVGVVVGLVIAAAREALRYASLAGVHGYDFMDYRVILDWYSTVLFFGTFAVVGGLVLAYLITVAWQAGRTAGVYTPGPAVRRLGTLSIAAIVLWIVQYFAVGFIVWAS